MTNKTPSAVEEALRSVRETPSSAPGPDAGPRGTDGAPMDAAVLRADDFVDGKFRFPSPTTVGYQAIVVFSMKNEEMLEDLKAGDFRKANKFLMGLAWISEKMREGDHESLLDYATGGTVNLAEAAEILNRTVSMRDFGSYVQSGLRYITWVVGSISFTEGTGDPGETPAARGPNRKKSKSASSRSSR